MNNFKSIKYDEITNVYPERAVNRIFRVLGNRAYYFDETLTVKSIDARIWRKSDFTKIKEGRHYNTISRWYKATKDGLPYVNGNLHTCALAKLKEGDTFDDFIQLLKETEIASQHRNPWKDFERHFTVKRPAFRRIYKNKTKTFDFIDVELTLTSLATKEWLNKNRKQLDEYVIKILSQNSSFVRYGIPINCLKLGNLVLTKDNRLIYTFELKDKLQQDA